MDTNAAASPGPLPVAIAHVLFLDMVGYSRLPIEQQTRLICQLRECIAAAPEMRQGEALCLETGDGMALAFFHDPCAPIRCARHVAEAVPQIPALRLRMGLHTGPVHRIREMNGRENLTGGGINMAQRVMDCGGAGHILLSRSYAEVLLQFEEWRGSLHDWGEWQVKHGERVHLFSFHTSLVGNSHRPVEMPPARLTQAAQLTWAARHVWLTSVLLSLLMFFLLLTLFHMRITITVSAPSGSAPSVYAGPLRGGYR